jgi:hypothetical protein
MATTQTQLAGVQIHTVAGETFNTPVQFGQGGSAGLRPYDGSMLDLVGVSADNQGQGTSLTATFKALRPGKTTVTFLVNPQGITPIEVYRTFEVFIGVL